MVYIELLDPEKVIKPGQPIIIETSDPNYSGVYKSLVHDFYPDRNILKIAMPSYKGRLVPIAGGTIIYIKIIDGQSIYAFNSRVINYGRDEENFNVTYITVPKKIRRIQRRRFVRVNAVLRGRLKFSEEDKYVTFITKDVSAGGALIITKQPLPVGVTALVDLTFTPELFLKGQKSKIVREAGKTDEGYHMYGIEFQDLNDSLQSKILRFCFDIERKMKLQKMLKEES